MKTYARITLAVVAVLILAGAVELLMGRLPLGPDGRFGWWEGDICNKARVPKKIGFRDSVWI